MNFNVKDNSEKENLPETNQKSYIKWKRMLRVSGACALALDICGILMLGASRFGHFTNAEQFNQAGVWLIAAGAPLVFFAAHALNKTAQIEKVIKREIIRRKETLSRYKAEQWKESEALN